MKLQDILEDALSELTRGTVDRKHPFRFVTFTTVSSEGLPQSRMVVCRKVDRAMRTVRIYTDARSPKMKDLAHQNRASLLFWHPKKRWQIRLDVETSILEAQNALYDHLPIAGQHAYNTLLPPSQQVDELSEAHAWQTTYTAEHFSVIEGRILTMEILQLKDKEHLRAHFSFPTNAPVVMKWLVA